MVTAYQRFCEAIKTSATNTVYQIYFKKFLDYAQKEPEGLIKLSESERSDLIFNYIVHLKDQTERKGKPNPNSYNSIMSPVKLFFEMNDIPLNMTKIKSWYPKKIALSNQAPYDRKDVKELLDATTSIRNKAFIHFLASTGCRVGAIHTLNIEDVKPIEEGAVVTLYRDTTEEYRSCLTPEAYDCLKKYLAQRLNKNPTDPLFTDKGNVARIGDYGARDLIRHVREQAKLSVDNGRKSTRGKSQNHAFRKRFSICLANANVQSTFVEYMMGHYENQNKHYFRGVSDANIWIQFKKAIPELSIDISEQTKAEYERKELKLRESYEGEFKEKLETLEAKMSKMEYSSSWEKYLYMEKIHSTIPDEILSIPFDHEDKFRFQRMVDRMSLDEIDEWNTVCDILKKQDERIKLSESKKRIKQIKFIIKFKKAIKEVEEEQGKIHPLTMKTIVEEGNRIAKEWGLDYDRYE